MKINILKSSLLLAAVAVSVAGCSNQSNDSDSWWHSSKNVDYLTPESADTIKYAQAGEALTIVDMSSKERDVVIDYRYFAASGRDCLRVHEQQQKQELVICQYDNKKWGVSRSFGVDGSAEGLQ
ncbi:DVU3141 family protein [Idiomarina ramblicola]|uniref:Lipoprotein n=1 Tax=Idiomarina ramblicola TaxID=263724 RepID=A0A432Z1T1_9GAMM|nr:DVU3141 family protein [Idiomarina ramblicola]RUO71799.1 hypothetical protein CWI78_04590 [Idiomarina ramblicola]